MLGYFLEYFLEPKERTEGKGLLLLKLPNPLLLAIGRYNKLSPVCQRLCLWAFPAFGCMLSLQFARGQKVEKALRKGTLASQTIQTGVY